MKIRALWNKQKIMEESKSKGKGHPITGRHEGPEGEQLYSSIFP